MQNLHWLAAAAFLLHMLEELPRFPAWATRHFGTTSLPWYVYSHIVLTVIVVSICIAVGSADRSTASTLQLMLMWTFGFNAVFHLVTTAIFREYSPGLITGVVLFCRCHG